MKESDPRYRAFLLQKLAEREQLATVPIDLFDTSFPYQTDFIRSASKFKAALCTRRAGKSYAAGLYLVQEALKNPRCSVLYLALTKDTARGIMVKDILDPILAKYNVTHTFNKTTRSYTLSNGSIIYLAGADAKPKEMEKVLGQKYALVIIDECASFSQDLDALINKLIPAVANYDGTIVLIGTPSNYTNNKFYELTKPDATLGMWSVHRWSWRDNPHSLIETTRAHDRLLLAEPLKAGTNSYKQEWLGEWAIDESALCYHYTDNNHIAALPRGNYFYVLGVDLGWSDDTAFCVVAYSFTDPSVYIVETHKAQHLDLTAVANFTKQLAVRYPFVKYMIDGANKQGVEEMKARHQIPWQTTPKSPGYKFDAIQMMSADFQTRTIKILPNNEKLLKEYSQLVWDEHNPTQEKSSCKNHLSDAALYAFMASKHYHGKSPIAVTRPLVGTLPDESIETPRRYLPININTEPLEWLDYDYGDQ